VAIPTATPATRPFDTVAAEALLETQGFEEAGVPEPVNAVVDPTHTEALPEIVGKAFIVTVPVDELAA